MAGSGTTANAVKCAAPGDCHRGRASPCCTAGCWQREQAAADSCASKAARLICCCTGCHMGHMGPQNPSGEQHSLFQALLAPSMLPS